MEKIVIDPFPKKGEPDYGHLIPVVDFLLRSGNESANDYVWGVNRTGFFCHLKSDIDFDLLLEKFSFPESIKLDRRNQAIDCFNTYSIIKKV